MAAVVREASVLALKESMRLQPPPPPPAGPPPPGAPAERPPGQEAGLLPRVLMRHFQAALARVAPSVSKRDAKMYDALRRSLQGNLRSRWAGF